MKYLLFFFLLSISLACCAVIYLQIDKKGNPIFSDTPIGLPANILIVPEVNQMTPPMPITALPKTSVEPSNDIVVEARKPYMQFDFTSPVDQETIQNQPTISVSLHVAPPLQEDDVIQIYLDGNAWGNAQPNTHFEFTAPYRGTHTLFAKILDKNQRILKQTKNITIYVHQAHIPTSPPQPNNAF